MTNKTETREAENLNFDEVKQRLQNALNLLNDYWLIMDKDGSVQRAGTHLENLIGDINAASAASGDEAKGWIPIEEGLPEIDDEYYVTLRKGNTHISVFQDGEWLWMGDLIIAWKSKPAPYQPVPSPYVEDKKC